MSNSVPGESLLSNQKFREKIQSAETFSELIPIFDEITKLRSTNNTLPFWRSCNEFFNRGFDFLDFSEVNHAEQCAIVRKLVSLSLEDTKDQENETTNEWQEIRFIQFELRRKLKVLMRQIQISRRWELFRGIAEDLRKRILADATESVFATVCVLGIRSESIENALWTVARSDSKMSANAICTITELGIPRSEDNSTNDFVNELIEVGWASLIYCKPEPITHIIWYLCGPDGMDLVLDAIEKFADLKGSDYDVAMIFAGAAKAVDRCNELSPFHNKIWHVFKQNRAVISMNASFAFGCQSPEPVRDYLEWLLGYSENENTAIQFTITRSRISELFKPEHLDGFDLVDTDRISPFLKRIASEDTKTHGTFTTTCLDAKQSSLQWLQCLGMDDFQEVICSVIFDETNPYVVHHLVDCLSASRQGSFSPQLCKLVESANRTDSDEDGNYFRQSAAIRLAHASESKEAFLSMTKFGFLHRGHIPLAVIDALTDLAISRITLGDSSALQLIIEMTSQRSEKHHRDAGVAVFCNLLRRGYVDSNVAGCIWQMASDTTLDSISRGRAFVALGSKDVVANAEQLQWLRERAFSSDFLHQPDAFEGLLQRDGIQVSDYPDAAKFLGCIYESNQFQITDPRQLTAWHAHMLAILYRKDRLHATGAIESILKFANGTAVHQITWAIEQLGRNQPATVLEYLRDRVLKSNTRGRADTDLIRTLGVVSPNLISEIVDSGVWIDWLEPGRIALAESFWMSSNCDSSHTTMAVDSCASFINDPSFQVRRIAYRGFARLNPNEFELLLTVLSSNEDPELISRAAEAVRWLPSSIFDNDSIDDFGLATHPLPEIREIAKDAIIDRRNRDWCVKYTDEIVSAVKNSRLAAREFRLGLALEMIGDDETITRLRTLASDRTITPRIRFWLIRTLKAVEKQWKKTLGESAQPWSLIRGSVQRVVGTLYVEESNLEIPATIHLWKNESKNPTDNSTWGGVLDVSARTPIHLASISDAELRFTDRQSCKIRVSNNNWRSSGKWVLTFSSSSPWPEEQ